MTDDYAFLRLSDLKEVTPVESLGPYGLRDLTEVDRLQLVERLLLPMRASTWDEGRMSEFYDLSDAINLVRDVKKLCSRRLEKESE